jgi:CRISPR-associated endonuclease Cas2
MPKSIYSKKVLELLSRTGNHRSAPFYYHYPSLRLFRNLTKKTYYGIISQLEKSGSISFTQKNSQRFIKITSKGELELLIEKAKLPKKNQWDGKWRLILFDIPVASNNKRDKLRKLLKANNFYMLQASVFISPYPLNREAISYLRSTGLIGYIRILRVDEIDEEKDLKKHFKL